MHLIGDVGGTNIRLAAFEGDPQAACRALLEGCHTPQQSLGWHQVADLPSALTAFINDFSLPKRCYSLTLAVAGPTLPHQQSFAFTNRAQGFCLGDLTGFAGQVEVINDFAAQASLITQLDAGQSQLIKPGKTRAGAKAVLGPGTGLGVAGLSQDGRVITGEGGNVALPYLPQAPLAKIDRHKRPGGQPRLEDALSGQGLENIYAAQTGTRLAAAQISQAAFKGEARARAAFELFFDFAALGAANQALQYMAAGGVYFVGAIMIRNLPLLDATRFAETFCSIETHQDFLRDVPVHLVTAETSGLAGLAAYLGAAAVAS